MIAFSCPRCKTTQFVEDDRAGSKLPCSKCGQRLQVPPKQDLSKTVLGAPLFPEVQAWGRGASAPPPLPVLLVGPTCPHCGSVVGFDAARAGQQARCPHCHGLLRLPGGFDPVQPTGAVATADAVNSFANPKPRERWEPAPRRRRRRRYRDEEASPGHADVCGILSIVFGGIGLAMLCAPLAVVLVAIVVDGVGVILGLVGIQITWNRGASGACSIVGLVLSLVALLLTVLALIWWIEVMRNRWWWWLL